MEFKDRLRAARLKKGLTQDQLATKLGVAKSTLTGYEKGNREPDVFKIKSLVKILDVDADYLLGLKDDNSVTEIFTNIEQKISHLEKSDLTLQEQHIIQLYRDCPEGSRKEIDEFIEFKYTKAQQAALQAKQEALAQQNLA